MCGWWRVATLKTPFWQCIVKGSFKGNIIKMNCLVFWESRTTSEEGRRVASHRTFQHYAVFLQLCSVVESMKPFRVGKQRDLPTYQRWAMMNGHIGSWSHANQQRPRPALCWSWFTVFLFSPFLSPKIECSQDNKDEKGAGWFSNEPWTVIPCVSSLLCSAHTNDRRKNGIHTFVAFSIVLIVKCPQFEVKGKRQGG